MAKTLVLTLNSTVCLFFPHLTEKCRAKKKGPGPWPDSQTFHLHEKSGCLAMGPALFELQFISNSAL